MDLPSELFVNLIYFLSVDDLVLFRVVAKEYREVVKQYEGLSKEYVYPNSLSGCFESFPCIKALDATKCEVKATDFQKFGRLEELKVSTRPLETEDIFLSCPHLTSLQLVNHYIRPDIDTNLVFKGLNRLKKLHLIDLIYITDHALLYLPLLEELELWDRCGITGTGLQYLKRLKRLSIETSLNSEASLIQDDDLMGLPIRQLRLVDNNVLTDQGILHLTQLKKLVCVDCPQIQGVGFTALTSLQTVAFGDSVIHDVSCFSNIKNLTFKDCQIYGNLKCTWQYLEKLQFLGTTFRYPLSIQLMTAPKLKQLAYENCHQLKEEALRKTFGARLFPL